MCAVLGIQYYKQYQDVHVPSHFRPQPAVTMSAPLDLSISRLMVSCSRGNGVVQVLSLWFHITRMHSYPLAHVYVLPPAPPGGIWQREDEELGLATRPHPTWAGERSRLLEQPSVGSMSACVYVDAILI